MQPSTPSKVTAVEVVAAQPTDADSAAIAQLSAQANRSLPQVSYLVKIRLEAIPPATGQGWALYVGDFRVPKYWEYRGGIYFKVFDPQFFADHQGQALRFSRNGSEFIDTGLKLVQPPDTQPRTAGATLPLQSDVLK